MPVVQPKSSVNQAREKREIRYDKAIMEPGEYEITRSSTFTVKVPLKRRDNKWWVVVEEGEAEVVEEAVFRMWTYDEMVEMRKMATTYDQLRRVHMIDHDILNRLKMQKLMVAWSFGKGNSRLALHHVNGVLSDESWDSVRKLQTNIVKYLMDKMNEWYEYGG